MIHQNRAFLRYILCTMYMHIIGLENMQIIAGEHPLQKLKLDMESLVRPIFRTNLLNMLIVTGYLQ